MQATSVIIVAILAALVFVAILVWAGMRAQRTDASRERFGGEFDRTLEERARTEAAAQERADDDHVRPVKFPARAR